MASETDSLIAETLRLDAKIVSARGKLESCQHHSPPWWTAHEDLCEARDEYDGHAARSAPRLARMLKMHQELALYIARGVRPSWLKTALSSEFSYRVDEECVAEWALAVIEKIAKGESNGD